MRHHLRAGARLLTPTGAGFTLETLDERGIVLLLGEGQWPTRLPWQALEEIPGLFKGRGWLRTTGTFDTESEEGSLSAHLKRFVKR